MLITKFNKMIRNKIIWSFIAIVVSVFFVLSFSSTSFDGCTSDRQSTAGRMYGEDVSLTDFRSAMFFELNMGQNTGLQSDRQDARKRTWRRLALLSTANVLGLKTDDDEVRRAIGSEPLFSPRGQFEQQRYLAFAASQNIRPSDFEEYLRQDLTIRKMQGTAQAVTWIAPAELHQRLANLTDLHTIEIARLDKQSLTPDVSITEDEIRDFYNENTNVFTADRKVQVHYVEFPFSDYVMESNDSVQVKAYYNANIADYTPKATNTFEQPVPFALEEVREQIETIVKKQTSIEETIRVAGDFVDSLLPGGPTEPLSFSATAEMNDYEVKLTGLFSIDEPVEGLDVGYRFRNAAFGLVPKDPEGYFSDVLQGSNAAYVVAFATNAPSHVVALEDIHDIATEYALSNAAHVAFQDAVAAIRDDIAASISTGRTFRDALSDRSIAVTSVVFTVFDTLSTNVFDDAELLVPKIIDSHAGDLSEVVETPGGAMIAYATDRTPTTSADHRQLLQQLMLTLQGYRSELVFQDYANYLLDEAELEDLQGAQEPGEDGDQGRSPSSSPSGSGSR